MHTIEYEKIYLAKYIPEGTEKLPFVDLLDIYLPSSEEHPTLRIRKKNSTYEITKKIPVKGNDSSMQNEFTIPLSSEEFAELEQLPGKRVHKHRYLYPYEGKTLEIDVFQDDLEGLVLIDIEFSSESDKDKHFPTPDFCLADLTQEAITAGGKLAGKKYADIEDDLKQWKYKTLHIA